MVAEGYLLVLPRSETESLLREAVTVQEEGEAIHLEAAILLAVVSEVHPPQAGADIPVEEEVAFHHPVLLVLAVQALVAQ